MKNALKVADMALRVLTQRERFDQHVAERKAAYERQRLAKERDEKAAEATAS